MGLTFSAAATVSARASDVNWPNSPRSVAMSARFKSMRAFRSSAATSKRAPPSSTSVSDARRASSCRNREARSSGLCVESSNRSMATVAARIPLSAA